MEPLPEKAKRGADFIVFHHGASDPLSRQPDGGAVVPINLNKSLRINMLMKRKRERRIKGGRAPLSSRGLKGVIGLSRPITFTRAMSVWQTC